jgi:hypothetical protein
MNNSWKNLFQIINPSLNAKLISPETLSNITQVANLLPFLPYASEAGFECPLSSTSAEADFSLAFTTLNYGKESLVETSQALNQKYYNSSVWKHIYDFSKSWLDENSSLHDSINHVWLEFDIDKEFIKCPEPSLFFAPNYVEGESNQSKSSATIWQIEDALRLILKKDLPCKVKNKLKTCFEFLPSGTEIFQIGVMLPRKSESQTVRLCIRNIKVEEISDYLEKIGWLGSFEELNTLMSELSGFVSGMILSVAIEDKVFTKIGLECYFDKQPEKSPKCQSFLRYLVEQNLCTHDKATALLEWPGYAEEISHEEIWPKNFSNASKLLYPRFKSTFVRLLNHIKIVYQPNQPLQAKAYLWFSHRWLSPSGLFQK